MKRNPEGHPFTARPKPDRWGDLWVTYRPRFGGAKGRRKSVMLLPEDAAELAAIAANQITSRREEAKIKRAEILALERADKRRAERAEERKRQRVEAKAAKAPKAAKAKKATAKKATAKKAPSQGEAKSAPKAAKQSAKLKAEPRQAIAPKPTAPRKLAAKDRAKASQMSLFKNPAERAERVPVWVELGAAVELDGDSRRFTFKGHRLAWATHERALYVFPSTPARLPAKVDKRELYQANVLRERWQGNPPLHVHAWKLDVPGPGERWAQHGAATSIVYRSDKRSRTGTHAYHHEFGEGVQVETYKQTIRIRGGRLTVTDRGIVN